MQTPLKRQGSISLRLCLLPPQPPTCGLTLPRLTGWGRPVLSVHTPPSGRGSFPKEQPVTHCPGSTRTPAPGAASTSRPQLPPLASTGLPASLPARPPLSSP